MKTANVTVGSFEVVLKCDILKKDIVPLSKIEKIEQENLANEDALTNDPELAVRAMDILIDVFVVSIDGKSDKKEIRDVVENMLAAEYGELTRAITSNMAEIEKKSENSTTSTKPSSTAEAEDSQKNG
ncbi:MAG: hypothetical protein QMC36_00275 [Patescibacteria group bacterium]